MHFQHQLKFVQIGNTPSNLQIVDYSHGMTGSAHYATAFEHTTAAKYPDWFFEGEEFAWADSAYAVNSHTCWNLGKLCEHAQCAPFFGSTFSFCCLPYL